MNLNTALLAAHDRGDKPQLVKLYSLAADQSDSEDERGFFLTQAYIFALDCNDPMRENLRNSLAEMSRI